MKQTIKQKLQTGLKNHFQRKYGWMQLAAVLSLNRELEAHAEDIELVEQDPRKMYWDHGRGFYKKIEFINERNEAAKRLGQLWEKYGQLECAAENFASIQLPSVDDPTLEHAGDLYLQTGNSEQAFQAYRRAINKSNRRLNDIPVIDSMFPSLSRSWDIQIIKDTGEKRDTILAKIKKNGLERFANHLPLNWANTHDSSLEYF